MNDEVEKIRQEIIIQQEKGYFRKWDKGQPAHYRSFMNDVIHNVAKGEVDYVFFLYQVKDLLTVFPDAYVGYHSEDKYFTVWR